MSDANTSTAADGHADTLPRSSSEDVQVGRLVDGRYRLEAVIGRGGMATVYRARHEVTGRRVAVKLLHPRPEWSATEVERLLREARIGARLGHPNVIVVIDAGTADGGAPFLVMELLEGESLRARLERAGRLEPTEAVRVTRSVLSALEAAHEAGVVHRDVKPENVFLARGEGSAERVLLLDFGISKVLDSHRGSIAPKTLTETGAILGTVAYMSPEQLRGEAVDGRTDLWSTGVMLYEMLAGRAPFTGKTAALLTMAILMGRAPPLDKAVRGLPRELVSVVSALMVAQRGQRAPSAGAVLKALDAISELPSAGALSVLPPPPELDAVALSESRPRTSWRLVAPLFAAVMALVAWRTQRSVAPEHREGRDIASSPAPPRAVDVSVAPARATAAVVTVDAAEDVTVVDAAVDVVEARTRRVMPAARPVRGVPRQAPATTEAPRPQTPGGVMLPATDIDGT